MVCTHEKKSIKMNNKEVYRGKYEHKNKVKMNIHVGNGKKIKVSRYIMIQRKQDMGKWEER